MAKKYGLRLTLGGAADADYDVVGIGVFRPGQVIPLEDFEVIDLETAKRMSNNPGCPVELVEIPEDKTTKEDN